TGDDVVSQLVTGAHLAALRDPALELLDRFPPDVHAYVGVGSRPSALVAYLELLGAPTPYLVDDLLAPFARRKESRRLLVDHSLRAPGQPASTRRRAVLLADLPSSRSVAILRRLLRRHPAARFEAVVGLEVNGSQGRSPVFDQRLDL